jgi:hypothetical protein
MRDETKHSPAFLKGMDDFKRGFSTNPFQYGRGRRGWRAGFEHAQMEQRRAASQPPGAATPKGGE